MNASSDRDQVAAKMGSIMSRLGHIEEKQTEGMKDLDNYWEGCIKGGKQKLGEYLKSDDVRARFTMWTLDDVPKAESSWEVTKSNITKALQNRLREITKFFQMLANPFCNTFSSGTILLKDSCRVSRLLSQMMFPMFQKAFQLTGT